MKVKFILHADFEAPGTILEWVKEKNHQYSISKPFAGDDCLEDIDFNFLVVMGGPQTPLKLEQFPYLKDEISLIKIAINKKIPIIGVCLGAQLIGEALGAKTEKSPNKEIGLLPIFFTEKAKNDHIFKDFPNQINVGHWHNDMPGLTNNSEILAYSEGCQRQIVKYDENIYGFQCHIEFNIDNINDMVSNCPEDIKIASKYVQAKDELLSANWNNLKEYMYKILDKIESNNF